MSSVIERDGNMQVRFGQSLEDFYENMRGTCRSLRGHIEDAKDNIQADNAVAALDYLLELIAKIEADLPGISEYGQKQIELGRLIREGESFKFSR